MFTQVAGVSEPISTILNQDSKPRSAGRLRAEFSAKAEITAWAKKLNTNDSIGYEWRRDCHLLSVNRSTVEHDAEN
jgi:hypothetical protein